jgi:hypothetical protein
MVKISNFMDYNCSVLQEELPPITMKTLQHVLKTWPPTRGLIVFADDTDTLKAHNLHPPMNTAVMLCFLTWEVNLLECGTKQNPKGKDVTLFKTN